MEEQQLLDGRYETLELLGSTAQSAVHAGLDRTTGQRVCLKLMRPAAFELDAEAKWRFRREASVLARLNHPYVVGVHALGEVDGGSYLVMELVEGQSLADRVSAGALSVEATLRILVQLVEGLSHVHRHGVVHRDLKPANVLLEGDDEDPRVRIIDFGFANAAGDGAGTDDGAGTLHYMAPEQLGLLERPVGPRSDLYSVGCIAYECLTATLPLDAPDVATLLGRIQSQLPQSLRARRAEVPPALERVVDKLLAKNPDDRYQSADGLLADLQRIRRDVEAGRHIPTFRLDRGSQSSLSGIGSVFVGRKDELAAAEERVSEVVAGGSRVLLVGGRSGIGKSAFVREVFNRAITRGFRFFRGKCYAMHTSLPYFAVAEALADALGAIRRQPDQEAVLAAVQERVGEDGGELVRLAPGWKEVFPDAREPEYLGEEADRARLLRVVAAVLESSATPERPLALFLDDLQWADTGTIELIVQLVGALQGAPLLVVGTYRTEEVGEGHPLQKLSEVIDDGSLSGAQMELGPLSEPDIEALLETLFGSSNAEFAKLLHGRAQGNAFFTCELLRAYARAEVLSAGESGLEIDLVRAQEVVLPTDLLDVVLRRVDTLRGTVREVLGVGALLGRGFAFELVSAVLDQPGDEIYEALREAVEAQLIQEVRSSSGTAYAFAHDKILEACDRLLGDDVRRRTHGRIAARLAEGHDVDANEDRIYDIAFHYARSDETGEAIDYCTRAGDLARTHHANEQALRFYASADELLGQRGVPSDSAERITLTVKRSEVLDTMGSYEEAAKGYREALELTKDPVDVAGYLAKIAYGQQKSGRYEESKANLLHALRLLGVRVYLDGVRLRLGRYVERLRYGFGKLLLRLRGRRDDPPVPDRRQGLVIEILTRLWYFYGINDVAKMYYLAYRLLAMALPFTHSRELSSAHRLMAITLCQGDRPSYAGAIRHSYRAVEVARRVSAKMELAVGYCYVGVVETWRGRPRDAMPYLQTAREMLEAIGNLWDLVNSHIFSYMCNRALGKLDEALSHALAIVQIAERAGAQGSLSSGYQKVGEILVLKGERAKGFDYIEQALTIAEDGKLRFDSYMSNKLLGLMLIREGRLADARKHLERAIELNERPDSGFMRAYVHDSYVGWAEAVLRDDDYLNGLDAVERDRVLDLVRRRLSRSVEMERRYLNHLVYALRVRARLWRRLGLERRMHADLAEARQVLDAEARPLERACLLMDTAELTSNPVEAERLLDEARRLFEEHGVSGEVARVNALRRVILGADRNTETEAQGGRAAAQLQSLISVSQIISSILDPAEAMVKIVDTAVELLGAERGFLLLANEQGDRSFHVRVARDSRARDIPETERNMSFSVVEQVARDKTPLVVTDAISDERFSQKESVIAANLRSVVCVPLVHKDELYGVIYLDSRLIKQLFNKQDVELVGSFATQAAIVLSNTRAYGMLRDLNENLEQRVVERTAQLESTQEKLIISEKMASIGQLVAGLAHEINNPVNFIYGNMEFFREYMQTIRDLDAAYRELELPAELAGRMAEVRDDLQVDFVLDDLQSLSGAVQEGAERIRLIVQSLLSFARGQHETNEHGSIDVNGRIDAAIMLLGASAKDRIEIHRDYQEVPPVYGSPGQLDQVFLNLLVNACHAIEDTGHIHIRTRRAGNTVEIEVQDTGCGMPEDVIKRIFDPFFTTKPVGQGTGLGLSLVYNTIRNHGGAIDVTSEAGQGTTFKIVLPLDEAGRNAIPAMKEKPLSSIPPGPGVSV